jgi:hypothetical protein
VERQTIRWATVGAGIIGLSVCTQQAQKVAQPPPPAPLEAVPEKAAISPRKVVPRPAEKPDPPATDNPLAKERENTDSILQDLQRQRDQIGPPVHRQGTTLETDTSFVPP